MANLEKAFEAAARALCRYEGHPEEIRFERQAMWRSYLPEAKAAIEAALPHLGENDPPHGCGGQG